MFKMTDIQAMYTTRLQQLGTTVTGCIHSTRLKDRILAYFPDMEVHKQRHDVVLIRNQDIGDAIAKACEHDADSNAVHLARAAQIVRKDMLNHQMF